MYIDRILNPRKENQVRNIMENNIITLRKEQKKEKSNIKLKDNNISSFTTQEKNYLISSSSFNNMSNDFIEYWNSEKNKVIILLKLLKEEELMLKYSLDKTNLTKFILFQLNQIIISDLNDDKNIQLLKNIFDCNIINKLIILLNKFTNNKYYTTDQIEYNNISRYKDNEVIIYKICKILIKLTVISSDFSSLITQNDKNLELILSSLKYFQKKNQFISSNLLILIYNLYLDDGNTILKKSDIIIPFIFENLYNYQNNPIENIIHIDFLYSLLEFLSLLINENTFHIINKQNINKYLSFIISIYQNYANDTIKTCSLNCLSNLLHCFNENTEIKIDNLIGFIKSLLKNLNIELNNQFIFIKTLEIISSISYLFEIEEFSSDELLNEINQILISLILHKEQIQLYYNKIQLNSIFENISILLLNFCLSSKICEYITQNTSIIKNVILILYNYSLEINTAKNLYNFLNEFMDNIDNFIFLVLSNFLEIGIVKNLDKYTYNKNYEIILMILNLSYKALEFGNIEKNQNISLVNFVQSFLDKKGFNDKLNIIISPDFKNIACSNLAKRIQEDYFS